MEAHKIKKDEAERRGEKELAMYYGKEIENMKVYMEKKKRQLGK